MPAEKRSSGAAAGSARSSQVQAPGRGAEASSRKRTVAAGTPKPAHRRSLGDKVWASMIMFWEGSSASYMLEPWEKILLLSIIALLTFLFGYALVFSFPLHLKEVRARALYYLTGLAHHGVGSSSAGASNAGAAGAAGVNRP